MKQLTGKMAVPGFIDLVKHKDDYYLITEFIDGETLGKKVFNLHGSLPWGQLSKENRNVLLQYFKAAVTLVGELHRLGYIHRDVQINNFLVKENKLYLIDFELAYSVKDDLPDPAFTLGTYGFVSPEQIRGNKPGYHEDVYSLGALLAFIILNPPSPEAFTGNLHDNLVLSGADDALIDVIVYCLHPEIEGRPSVAGIER